MSTMLDQLRELERLIVELGAKMGCPFEEPRDRFQPSPIDLEMYSYDANPAGADSAGPRVLGDSRETLSCNLGRYTMVEKDSTKNQVSTAPAITTVLGTPNDADRLSRAGMAEGNSGNRILGGRWPEVVQEMELQKDETKSCSCSNPIAFSCEQQLAELPPPNQLLSQFGVHLDAEAKSILQGKICEVLPSSEIGIGNVKFLELEFLEFDGMKCGGLVRDCEKPDFHAFGVSLGSWNLDLHPQVVDGNVGSKAMEFRVMNQPFLNAHEVFDKLSVKEMGDYDGSVCFLSIFGDGFDYSSSFVFDPGKIIDFKVKWLTVEVRSAVEMVERGHRNVSFFVFDPGKNNNFLLHNGSLEALITLVFDPGGDQVLLRFVLENFPFGQACAGKSPFCLASHLGATEACLKTLGVMLNFCLQCAESSHIWTCADITH